MALNEKIKVEIPKHCVKVPTGNTPIFILF